MDQTVLPTRRLARKSGPAPKRRHRKTEQRRQQIFSGALSCFEQKGYHETTVADIAAAAGISSGLIYQYFNDKRDLLFQVILEILEAYNRDVPSALIGVKDPLERLQAAAIAYYKVIDQRVQATLFSYRESASLEKEQIAILKSKELQTNQLIVDCVLECERAGFCMDVDPELATYWIINSAHAWGLKNWRLRKIISFDEYARKTLGVIIRGMLNDAGEEHFSRHNLLDGRPL